MDHHNAWVKALSIRAQGIWMALRGRWWLRRGDVVRDVAYGDHPRQRLDIHVPDGLYRERPVVVFVHGGAYQSFDKDVHAAVGWSLAKRGLVTVLPNYRLYPEVRWPVFVKDAAQALEWTRAQIGGYGGDGGRVVAVGHSAGAISLALLAVDGARYEISNDSVRGWVLMSGLYDHSVYPGEQWVDIMGGQEAWAGAAQPRSMADRKIAERILMIHGGRDELCPPEQADAFYRAVRAAGNDVQMEMVEQWHHYDTVYGLSRTGSRVVERVVEFVEAASGGGR